MWVRRFAALFIFFIAIIVGLLCIWRIMVMAAVLVGSIWDMSSSQYQLTPLGIGSTILLIALEVILLKSGIELWNFKPTSEESVESTDNDNYEN